MSVTETVLYFVVIPAVAVLVIAGLSLAGGGRSARRYRPGRSYDFTPVWFLSSPELLSGDQSERHHDDHGPAALPSGTTEAPRVPAGSTGGASDRW